MLSLAMTYTITDNFLFTVSYGHLLQLPLGITEYKPVNKTAEKWIQAGALSLTLHFRFGMDQKL